MRMSAPASSGEQGDHPGCLHPALPRQRRADDHDREQAGEHQQAEGDRIEVIAGAGQRRDPEDQKGERRVLQRDLVVGREAVLPEAGVVAVEPDVGDRGVRGRSPGGRHGADDHERGRGGRQPPGGDHPAGTGSRASAVERETGSGSGAPSLHRPNSATSTNGRNHADVEVEPVGHAELQGDQHRRAQGGQADHVAPPRDHRGGQREAGGGDLDRGLRRAEAADDPPDRERRPARRLEAERAVVEGPQPALAERHRQHRERRRRPRRPATYVPTSRARSRSSGRRRWVANSGPRPSGANFARPARATVAPRPAGRAASSRAPIRSTATRVSFAFELATRSVNGQAAQA